MQPQETDSLQRWLQGLDIALGVLQKENRFPSYYHRFEFINLTEHQKAIRFLFRTHQKGKDEFEFIGVYPYVYEVPGIAYTDPNLDIKRARPMSPFQVIEYATLYADFKQMMTELIVKYPGCSDIPVIIQRELAKKGVIISYETGQA